MHPPIVENGPHQSPDCVFDREVVPLLISCNVDVSPATIIGTIIVAKYASSARPNTSPLRAHMRGDILLREECAADLRGQAARLQLKRDRTQLWLVGCVEG